MSATGRNLEGREVNALGAYDTPAGLCRAVVERLDRLGVIRPGQRILEPSCGSGNWIRALFDLQLERRKQIRLAEAAGTAEAFGALPDHWVEGGACPALHLEAMDVDPTVAGLDLAYEGGGTVTTCDRGNFDRAGDAWARRELRAMGVPDHRWDAAAAGFLTTAPAERPDLILGNPPYSVTAPRVRCPTCDGTGRLARKDRGGQAVPAGLPVKWRKCPDCDRWPEGRRPDGLPLGMQPELVIQVADLHIRRALEVTRRHVVMVLRLPLLGGRDRFGSLWSLGNLREVWTVVGRPSFAHQGTDSVESAVFWWDREWRPRSALDGPSFVGRWITWGET